MRPQLSDVEYEHIFSDNSPTDRSVEIIRSLIARDPWVKLTVNSRNLGAPRNTYRAMYRAKGQAIVPMLPVDLQSLAETIPEFYKLWKEGVLTVFGICSKRQEGFVMKSLRSIHYRTIRKFTNSDISINAREFMSIDRKVADSLLELQERNPYLRGLNARVCAKLSYAEYGRKKHERGYSNATPKILMDTAINGLANISRLPARISLLFSFSLSIVGVFLEPWSLIANLIGNSGVNLGIPTILLGIFFFGGAQLLFLRLKMEYVLNIHSEVKPDPKPFDIETS